MQPWVQFVWKKYQFSHCNCIVAQGNQVDYYSGHYKISLKVTKMIFTSNSVKKQEVCFKKKKATYPNFISLHSNWEKVSNFPGRNGAHWDEKRQRVTWSKGWQDHWPSRPLGSLDHSREDCHVSLNVLKDTDQTSRYAGKRINIGLWDTSVHSSHPPRTRQSSAAHVHLSKQLTDLLLDH